MKLQWVLHWFVFNDVSSLNLIDVIYLNLITMVFLGGTNSFISNVCVYFIAGIAETNRAPFDVAEGESRLLLDFMLNILERFAVFFWLNMQI